ncbi:MAG TPA: ABC transporter substrate-binding protein [Polyangiaceae bacterium]
MIHAAAEELVGGLGGGGSGGKPPGCTWVVLFGPSYYAWRSVRIASLLPSGTEIVCSLGARSELVGRSHECDFPEEVSTVPVLSRSRLSSVGSSADLDRDVRRLLAESLSIYEVSVEALAAARPDVIVTQDLCDVCAVSLGDVCRAASEVLGSGVEIVSLRPERLAAIWDDVRRVARAIGRGPDGERVETSLKERVEAISVRVPASAPRCSVLSVEWLDPVMIGGLWMPELIELAGGLSLVTRPGDHAPTLAASELRRLDPDVVLIKPCGFTLDRALSERHTFVQTLPWSSFRAVREGRAFVADGSAYFNRSGPRIVESLEILAACLHPEAFVDFRRKHAPSACRLTGELEILPL